MKRIFDLGLSVVVTGLLIVPIIITAIVVKLSSRGPVLYWSDRVGKDNHIFRMPKFRSMKIDTPAVATCYGCQVLPFALSQHAVTLG